MKTNPFSPEAVATYGQATITCADLQYMRQARTELEEYLKSYPDSGKRYGAAIGLRGEHGSGKTHLLNWLAEQARAFTHGTPVVLYAKADQASLFDVYTQLMDDLPRERLQQVFAQALQTVAIEHVQTAQATQSIQARIRRPEDLNLLYQEELLNPPELVRLLQNKLEAAPLPVEIPRTLLQINDPIWGELAYQWLLGREVEGLENLGLRHRLLQLQSENDHEARPDLAAVNVLETIAALCSLAGQPLLILIDQLEVLLRTAQPTRRETLYSQIKKLIEQLSHQHALLFIAGNLEAWQQLPRDVTPRLRQREPLTIGNLAAQEIGNLLQAYTTHRFSEAVINTLCNLSGGSPREVLRIAYFAFEAVHGEVSEINPDTLIASARQSGSVAERNRLALLRADEVLERYGEVRKDFGIGEGVVLQRLLEVQGQAALALATIKAVDKLSEIDSARRINQIRRYLEATWPGAPLLVVAVGYASREVETLLGQTVSFLVFHEADFAPQLQTKVAEFLARQPAPPANANPELMTLLQGIAAQLNKLETQRGAEVKQAAQDFAALTAVSAEPEVKERALKTRWEMLEVLDDLRAALRDERPRREREMIASLLVANEAIGRNDRFDFLGLLYVDALNEELEADRLLDQDARIKLTKRLKWYREDMLNSLKAILRPKPLFIYHWLESPVKYLSLLWLVGSVLLVGYRARNNLRYSLFESFIYATIYSLPFLLFLGVGFAVLIFVVYWMQALRWQIRLNSLRQQRRALAGQS